MPDSPDTFAPALQSGTERSAEAGGNGAAHPQLALADRMAQGAHHTIDRLADSTAPHLQRLERAVAGAGGQLKQQVRQARETGDEWAENLRGTVRRHPLTALAAALAIGAVIARLTR